MIVDVSVISHHLSNNIDCFSSLSTVLSIIVSSSYHRSEIHGAILPPRRPKPMMIVEIYILRPVVLGYVPTGSTYYSIIQEYDQKVEMRELVGVLRLIGVVG